MDVALNEPRNSRIETNQTLQTKGCVCHLFDAIRATIFGIIRNITRKPADMQHIEGKDLHSREIRQYGKKNFTAIKVDSFAPRQIAEMGKTQLNYWLGSGDKILEAAPYLQNFQLIHVFKKTSAARWNQIVENLTVHQIEELEDIAKKPRYASFATALENGLFYSDSSSAWDKVVGDQTDKLVRYMLFKADPCRISSGKIARLSPEKVANVMSLPAQQKIPAQTLAKLSSEQVIEILNRRVVNPHNQQWQEYFYEIVQQHTQESKHKIIEKFLEKCEVLSLEQFDVLLSLVPGCPEEVVRRLTAKQFSDCFAQQQHSDLAHLPLEFQTKLAAAIARLAPEDWKGLWNTLGTIRRYPLADTCLIGYGKPEFFEQLSESENSESLQICMTRRFLCSATKLLHQNDNQDPSIIVNETEEHLKSTVIENAGKIMHDQILSIPMRSYVFNLIISEYQENNDAALIENLRGLLAPEAAASFEFLQECGYCASIPGAEIGVELAEELLCRNFYALLLSAPDLPVSIFDCLLSGISEGYKRNFQHMLEEDISSSIGSINQTNKMRLLPYLGGNKIFESCKTISDLIKCAATMTSFQLEYVIKTQRIFTDEDLLEYLKNILADSCGPRKYGKLLIFLDWFTSRIISNTLYNFLLYSETEIKKDPAYLYYFVAAFLNTRHSKPGEPISAGIFMEEKKFSLLVADIKRYFDEGRFAYSVPGEGTPNPYTQLISGVLQVILDCNLKYEDKNGYKNVGSMLYLNLVVKFIEIGVPIDFLLHNYFDDLGIGQMLVMDDQAAANAELREQRHDCFRSVLGSKFYLTFLSSMVTGFEYMVIQLKKKCIESDITNYIQYINTPKDIKEIITMQESAEVKNCKDILRNKMNIFMGEVDQFKLILSQYLKYINQIQNELMKHANFKLNDAQKKLIRDVKAQIQKLSVVNLHRWKEENLQKMESNSKGRSSLYRMLHLNAQSQ